VHKEISPDREKETILRKTDIFYLLLVISQNHLLSLKIGSPPEPYYQCSPSPYQQNPPYFSSFFSFIYISIIHHSFLTFTAICLTTLLRSSKGASNPLLTIAL